MTSLPLVSSLRAASLGLVAAGMLAGCSSLTPADDPVFLRVQDLDARLIRIERVVENQSLIELATEIQSLRTETAALRGEIETLRFETDNANARQRDLYVDLDQRLQDLEQARLQAPIAQAPAGAAAGAAAAASTAATVSDQQAYDRAFELVQARRYDDAAAAFVGFLTTYPGSGLRDNAQYWLSEMHYVRGDFTTALTQFQKVLAEYPQSAKLPDALLKIGYCNYELKHWDAARQALQEVARLYPDTTAARLATQRLDRIAQETR